MKKKSWINFDIFVNSDHIRNTWIYERDISIYVRRSQRFIDGKVIPCLDIGSVEVIEKHRGIGIFTSFLNRFEEAAKKLNRAVFVESILEPRLVSFLNRREYTNYRLSTDLCPSMYKKFS